METSKPNKDILKDEYDAEIDMVKFLLNIQLSFYEARLNSVFAFYKSLFAIYGTISALLLIVPLKLTLSDFQSMLLFYAILSFVLSIIVIVIAMQIIQYAINLDLDEVYEGSRVIFKMFSEGTGSVAPRQKDKEKEVLDWYWLSFLLNWLSVVLFSSGFILTIILAYNILVNR